MRQRSNLIILFGIAFFLVGGVLTFSLLDGEDENETACWERGGVPVQAADGESVVCIAPEALQQ